MNQAPKIQECRSCKAKIVFLKTRNNRTTPVDADTWNGEEEYQAEKHVSHFATCPDAAKYRKNK